MMKKLLSSVLILGQLFAVTPSKAALSESDKALVDAGKNLLKNPGFESGVSFWTASGGATATANSTAKGTGALGYDWDSNSASQTLTSSAVTIPAGLQGKNGMISCDIKTVSGTATHTIGLWDGTTLSSTQTITSSTASFPSTKVNMPFPSSGTAAIRLTSVNANEPEVYIDDCKISLADNIGTVAQSTLVASGFFATTASCNWSRTNTALGAFTTTAACPGPTITTNDGPGAAQTTDVDLPRVTINNAPAGTYEVIFNTLADFTSVSNTTTLAISDGTNTYGNHSYITPSSGGAVPPITVVAAFKYTTPGNRSFELYGAATGAAILINNANGLTQTTFSIRYTPSSSQQAVSAEQQRAPTIQRLTSGTTYTRPNGVTFLKIKMVGAGGGGAGGSQNTFGGAGGAGGNTTFSTFLTANGGSGGSTHVGGSGGAATISLPAYGTALSGGSGGGGTSATINVTPLPAGGTGAASPFGGAGGSRQQGVGFSAIANSGSGAGGGAITNTVNGGSGAGGGAGGFIEAIVPNPDSTYTYSIPSGGTAGTAGTSGFAGGIGGSGYIEVTEYYSQSAPILIGSVTSNSSGAERIERAYITKSGACTINTQSGSWLTSATANGTGRCDIVWPSSTFSATPSCITTNAGTGSRLASTNPPSTTGISVFMTNPTSLEDNNFNIVCIGPR